MKTSFRPALAVRLAAVPAAFFLASTALAGPLQQAEINKIVNDVRVVDPHRGGARPASVRDVIKDDLAVRTGVQSRAELLFQDQTLTRLGADAFFSFTPGTRDMTLDRGTMLLQVPKGLGGARIRAAAVTAAITGTTIMIENVPGDHVKVLVLEGSLRLSLNGRFGETAVLNPGRMVIIGAKERALPKPVTVDLTKLVKTSALVDPAKFSGGKKAPAAPLPSMGLIQKEMAIQAGAKGRAELVETNQEIHGNEVASVKKSPASEPAVSSNAGKIPVVTALDNRSRQQVKGQPVGTQTTPLATTTGSSGLATVERSASTTALRAVTTNTVGATSLSTVGATSLSSSGGTGGSSGGSTSVSSSNWSSLLSKLIASLNSSKSSLSGSSGSSGKGSGNHSDGHNGNSGSGNGNSGRTIPVL